MCGLVLLLLFIYFNHTWGEMCEQVVGAQGQVWLSLDKDTSVTEGGWGGAREGANVSEASVNLDVVADGQEVLVYGVVVLEGEVECVRLQTVLVYNGGQGSDKGEGDVRVEKVCTFSKKKTSSFYRGFLHK
jgi:hypothetical protein